MLRRMHSFRSCLWTRWTGVRCSLRTYRQFRMYCCNKENLRIGGNHAHCSNYFPSNLLSSRLTFISS